MPYQGVLAKTHFDGQETTILIIKTEQKLLKILGGVLDVFELQMTIKVTLNCTFSIQ